MKEPLILFKNFSFRYFLRETEVLSDINFSVSEGEFIILTGSSGSGKSTICYGLLGLIPHFYAGNTGGKILFRNKDLLSENQLELIEDIGYVPQRTQNSFVTPYVVTELAFPIEYSSSLNDETEANQIIRSIISEVGLEKLLKRKINKLSEGEKQLVAIGSALAKNPSVIIADEPLTNLDEKNRQIILRKFHHYHKLGKTIIIATHEHEKYINIADRIIKIENGIVVENIKLKNQMEYISLKETIEFPIIEAKQITEETIDIISLEMEDLSLKLSEDFQIKDVNVKVRSGEITGLVGDNGSGKTTILKLLCGLLKPDEGSVQIKGKNINSLNWNTITSKFGVIFQDPDKQFFEATTKEEIALISINLGKTPSYHTIATDLSHSGLKQYDEYNPHSLSYGEKRRLVFLTAIHHEPEFIIIDEITNGMDEENKSWLEEQLEDLRRQGKTIIVISHDWIWLRRIADRMIFLEEGQVKSVLNKDNFPIQIYSPKEEPKDSMGELS